MNETDMPDDTLPVHRHRGAFLLPRDFRRLRLYPAAVAVAVCGMALVALVAGLWQPSSNGDSLNYHLARTQFWIQSGSLDFYTTPIKAQLHHPPLASILMMYVRLLTGSDRLAFMVSWLSYVGCLWLVWKIARKLNGNATLAVVFAATVPMMFLQAGSTQNNLLTAMWLLAVVWFVLDDAPLYVGIAVGLAMLTKSTTYFYLVPLLLWFAWRMIRAQYVAPLLLAGVIAFTLNAPHWTRNYLEFGSPNPSAIPYGAYTLHYNYSEISPRMFIAGTARSIEDHLPFPGDALAIALGLDLHDPTVSREGSPARTGIAYWTDSTGGAPIHMAIVLVILPFAVLRRGNVRAVALCCMVGFVLFAGLVLWLPWQTRLHLPLFLLGAPVVAYSIPRSLHRGLSVVLLLFAVVVVFANDERPPQKMLQAYHYPAAYRKYYEFAEAAKEDDCRVVYLAVGGSDPVFLLARLMPHHEFTFDEKDKRACMTFYSWDTTGVRQMGGK